jgi:hypothetical protein
VPYAAEKWQVFLTTFREVDKSPILDAYATKTGKHVAISWFVSKKLPLDLAVIPVYILLSGLHLNGFE